MNSSQRSHFRCTAQVLDGNPVFSLSEDLVDQIYNLFPFSGFLIEPLDADCIHLIVTAEGKKIDEEEIEALSENMRMFITFHHARSYILREDRLCQGH
jgi:hypothetical protein